MTRRETIAAQGRDAQALALAGLHAAWLLGGRAGPAPGLDAALGGAAGRGRDGAADGPTDGAVERPEDGEDSGLAALIARFGLTAPMRDALLIVAAADLDPATAAALAAHPLAVGGRATPALLDAVLPELEARALTPAGMLRRALLIRAAPGPGLAHRPLWAPETVLHFLRGAPCLSPALAAVLTGVAPEEAPESWTVRLARALAAARARPTPPILHLDARDPERAAAQAAGAFAALDLDAWRIGAADVPDDPEALAEMARRIDRDMALTGAGLIAAADGDAAGHGREDGREDGSEPLRRLIARVTAPAILVGGPRPRGPRPAAGFAAADEAQAGALTRAQIGAARWTRALGPAAEGRAREIDAVARHFRLSGPAMTSAAESVALGLEDRIWPRARAEAGRALEGLAERIRPTACWDDLALPPGPRRQLEQLAAFQRRRDQVNDAWGFAAKSVSGLGLAALFSGPSGAGKTMAAEIVARDLGPEEGLDLFRVDLSAIVSKYIGETEKNIARIFDAAERAGAVLIFDEGDALFGKRSSEVKDSIDRHSNNETAYLLQRLEAYSGAAIVTTNLRDNVDEAFLRRFRFVIEFPFPDARQREAIWRAALPPQAPVGTLDFKALARLSLSGGAIRATALTAAYLAADAGDPITMETLRDAARQEYAKTGKPFPESDARGRR